MPRRADSHAEATRIKTPTSAGVFQARMAAIDPKLSPESGAGMAPSSHKEDVRLADTAVANHPGNAPRTGRPALEPSSSMKTASLATHAPNPSPISNSIPPKLVNSPSTAAPFPPTGFV
jgi:hypothetical protein